MKAFEVTMSGIAKKVFTVVANNNEEAIKKAHDIYLNTDLIDFKEEDISTVLVTHIEEKYEVDLNDLCEEDCNHCPFGLKSECEAFRDRAEAQKES